MSEGDKQAPISSGWWYDLNLSFCISLLSAAGCRVTHALVAGVKRDFLPPPPPPPRHPEHCHLLSHLFLNLRGSVWSLLLKTAYFVIFWVLCESVNLNFSLDCRTVVELLLKEPVHVCVCFHDFSSRSSGVFICSCVAMKLTCRFAKKIIHYS